MATTFPTIELVAVRRPLNSTDQARREQRKAARMIITPEGNNAVPILIPFAPNEVSHSDLGGEYVVINRPGLPDVQVYMNELVPKMSFSLLVTDKVQPRVGVRSATVTAIAVISAIQQCAKNGTRVRITYGQLESGLWYIDSVGLSSVRRDPRTDEITQANMDLSFTRASDVVDGVGPVTGGVKPPAPSPAPKPPQKTSARYYTMKNGDTLWSVSIHFYGTGTKWRAIADANNITNVYKIPVGKVLRIP